MEESKNFIEEATGAKENFGDDKSLKELQVAELKKEMDELKELQTKTIQQLDDAKSAMEQYDYDVRAAVAKNPNTSSATLKHMVNVDDAILPYVLSNPNISEELLNTK